MTSTWQWRRRGSAWSAALRTPVGACSVALLVALAALAVLGPVLWGGQAAAVDTNAIGQGPSGAHLLGTDSLGRDIFSRTLVATRFSVELAVIATAVGVTVGLVLGTLPSVLLRRAEQADHLRRGHRGGVPRAAPCVVLRGRLRRGHPRRGPRHRVRDGAGLREAGADTRRVGVGAGLRIGCADRGRRPASGCSSGTSCPTSASRCW